MECVIKKCVGKAIKTGLCGVHYKRRAVGDYTIDVNKKFFGTFDEYLNTHYKKTNSGCHEWTGEINGHGYGRMSSGGKRILAHRYAWELKNGPIPVTKEIHHKCNNIICVNADHLEAISAFDHIRKLSRDKKGRLIAHSKT